MLSHPSVRAVLFVVSLAACSKQAEGERCDPNSGNLDCEQGLICRTGDQLSVAVGAGAGLCCPPDGFIPEEDACRAGAVLPEEPMPPAASSDAGDGGP